MIAVPRRGIHGKKNGGWQRQNHIAFLEPVASFIVSFS
jgi:hypothetical protein